MKRMFLALTAGVLALSILAGCGGAKPAAEAPAAEKPAAEKPAEKSATPTIDRIKKEGKLVIGTSPDYPPYESLDKDNKVVGFDIDIMQEVANKLGVKLEIEQMAFGGLLAALQAGKFDIMAAGVSVTEERKKAVDFSDPYIVGSNAVVVHQDFTGTISKLEDLAGKKVAVQLGTVQAEAVAKVNGATVKEYNLFTEAASAVSSKQADAMFISGFVAKSFVKADPNLKVVWETPADDTAYALRKDTPDLTKVVNEVLAELKQSGKMDQLINKWFK
ncbi:MAG: basic amino acid ABC transporter substrate-binding protein [Bacillota bacterium]